MNSLKTVLLSPMLVLATLAASAQQLAFPDAQGWGRFATGGRKGTVYHVTNLNDSGTGSLRDAVSQPNRIVVFDVAGVINISSRIVFKNNLYVAGQTAPGEGITVYGDGVSFSGASNIIVRHMRFRMGHKGSSGKDAAGLANGSDMIFDHCSFSWGLDETFSINPDGKGTTPHNITLSNCIIGQGLMTHSAGGLMQADSITLYRNLYVDNSTRNNKIKGRNQYVNNIVYNWKNGAYIMGGDSEGTSYCNIEGNLFINGPAVGGAAFTGANADFNCYGNDNWQDSNRDGVFNPSEITDYSASTRVSTPYPYPALEKWSGKELLERSLPMVGASLPYRDMADCYMIDEVNSLGTSGALISNEENLPHGAPSTWSMWAGEKRIDTDGDGMPDAWETANGTDPNKNDAMTIAANGYANIENYINSITVDDRQYFLRKPMCLELAAATTTTLKLLWCDYTYGEDGFVVEIDKGNGFEEAGRTAAGATTFTISGLESGTSYPVRVRAFAGTDKLGDYSATVNMDTRLPETGEIDIDRFVPDVTNALESNKDILIDSPTDLTFSVAEALTPNNVVVNSPAHITISGTGNIGGSGTMNKAGEGTLTVSTENTYTGATVLHEGVYEFNSLKNGGVASGLGAGIKDAQNWVMDGGTYRYTGGATTTDRSAKLKRPTTFEIANNVAVTMNGAIEGGSQFILDGKGQLTVGSTNFFNYTASTRLNGGTLYLSTVDIAKNGIGKSNMLILAGGTLKTAGESSGYETYSFPIRVVENTTSVFAPNRNCYINNTVTGNGTLQLNIPYLREYIKGSWGGFTGRLVANGVSTDSWGSLFLINDNGINLSNCVVEARGNTKVCIWATNGAQTLGGLSGTSGTYLMGSSKSTKNFTCSWTIGSANTDETFAGIINNNACAKGYTGTVSITKTGTGDWRLTGKNEYSGTTAVKGGRLIVNGTNSGTGAVTVYSEATLAGKGTVAGNVTVQSGGTIQPGDTLVLGSTLKLTGNCTLNSGSTMEIPVKNGGTTNYLAVTKTLTANGATLYVNTNAMDQPLAAGASLRCFTAATISGSGFAEILPATPGDGLAWDTTELMTKGLLKVASTSGISSVGTDGQRKDGQLYDLTGRRIQSPAKGGVYIQNGKKIIKE